MSTGEVIMLRKLFVMATGIMAAAIFAVPSMAAEPIMEWELVNPTGVIKLAQVEPARRITALDGKTVALRWNGKHNGDVVLDRIAELMHQKYPNTRIVKTYRDNTGLNTITGTPAISAKVTDAVAAVKPDLVIASQCD